MKKIFNLTGLDWTLEGYTPFVWLFERQYASLGEGDPCIDVRPIPAQVPGSVQGSLRIAGILPDWNIGTNYRACEWVEHRHWMYRTSLPEDWFEKESSFYLECQGLDYSGWVYLNGQLVQEFEGTHIPHLFDLTPLIQKSTNILEIIFDQPPRWLGQFGYTSQMTEWKPRFNYTWDWAPRLVQAGIWDTIRLVSIRGAAINSFWCTTDYDLATASGSLTVVSQVSPGADGSIHLSLSQEGLLVWNSEYMIHDLARGFLIEGLQVKPWWPNLEGDQPLYTLTCKLQDSQGQELDREFRQVGFKHVEWEPCVGAPEQADPWICIINGRPVFLQGVNFAPLQVNFADLKREDYRVRLSQYRTLGLNLFRINACQYLEKEWFYELCDEMGLMIWQEFPLTSSGLENWPPEDPVRIEEMASIARSFIERRQHHVSLLLWSGGNELQGDFEGKKSGIGKPCGLEHPMLKRLAEVVQELDPIHRYIPSSPCGPRAGANPEDFGKGLNWDVHGGAAMLKSLDEAQDYWAKDDALFRSEIYCPGASPVELIRKYAGDMDVFPPTVENPYWTRLTSWWLDWRRLVSAYGREPDNLIEYVSWSQAEQATRISLEMKSCKDRFPRCGGVLLWSGHDTFPLTINSSLIDFDGNLKPAALAVSNVWQEAPRNRGL